MHVRFWSVRIFPAPGPTHKWPRCVAAARPRGPDLNQVPVARPVERFNRARAPFSALPRTPCPSSGACRLGSWSDRMCRRLWMLRWTIRGFVMFCDVLCASFFCWGVGGNKSVNIGLPLAEGSVSCMQEHLPSSGHDLHLKLLTVRVLS